MSKSCPKCGRTMEEGFLIDAGESGMKSIADWHRGQPEKKWWGLKTSKADTLRISSWRCTSCGLIESYAK